MKKRPGPAAARALLWIACILIPGLTGCFTEIGNPGKEQTVSVRFRIDYSPALSTASIGTANPPTPAAKSSREAAPGATAAPSLGPSLDSLRILQFYFNVVEVNYDTADREAGRIWKVPDSLGKAVDFTGADPLAVLPPVAVPPVTYTFLKVESRIPAAAMLDPDTLSFDRFGDRGYIKGIAWYAGTPLRFICRFTDDYKINLVYTREILEQWRDGDAYRFDFVFFATRWITAADLTALETAQSLDGPLVLIDAHHNAAAFATLRASFFKSFNSTKVWKENPAP